MVKDTKGFREGQTCGELLKGERKS